MIIPVILSGGAGTRLWPLSRELYPKQLLPLAGAQTMLQETLCRLEGTADLGTPLVVCNEAHRFMVAEQLRSIDRSLGGGDSARTGWPQHRAGGGGGRVAGDGRRGRSAAAGAAGGSCDSRPGVAACGSGRRQGQGVYHRN